MNVFEEIKIEVEKLIKERSFLINTQDEDFDLEYAKDRFFDIGFMIIQLELLNKSNPLPVYLTMAEDLKMTLEILRFNISKVEMSHPTIH